VNVFPTRADHNGNVYVHEAPGDRRRTRAGRGRSDPDAESAGALKSAVRDFPFADAFDIVYSWGVLRLAALIRREGPVAVQAWLPMMNVVGGLAALLTRTPFAGGEQCCEPPDRRVATTLEKAVLARAAGDGGQLARRGRVRALPAGAAGAGARHPQRHRGRAARASVRRVVSGAACDARVLRSGRAGRD
jgi:hypothetical protein